MGRDGNEVGFFGYPPRPVPPLMGRGSILINGFGTGLGFFLKTRDRFGAGSGIAPSRPALIIYKINFKIKYFLNFKFIFYFTIFNI